MSIRNAVVPVAGLGTRLLPATKSQPKEMLPVGKKPIVQYVVDELQASGIERLLFVTGRGKSSIEDHFDDDPELVRMLRETGREDLLAELADAQSAVHFLYTRQRQQKGLGDAILCAEHFAGTEPFVVALGDSIIGRRKPSQIVERLVEAFEKHDAVAVIAVEEVPVEHTSLYGIVAPAAIGDVFEIADLIEKPKPADALSNLAIAARYVFAPGIFDAIRRTPFDRRGELQITDAIRLMLNEGGRIIGVRLGPEEKRYDIGNFESYFETFVEFALTDPVYGAGLRARAREILLEHNSD
ncbi:MAG: UTP--glucose-1-phosphate uridylyltransferase [Acidobacteria bacterium]|nr:UTP--glucose-1-phosphate uridylyltransferase [Acidobacteriota bacterium]MCW5969436.1 UTP--glucose-1-phosphate uridylyltransferase [Blastocatellales bacterium]